MGCGVEMLQAATEGRRATMGADTRCDTEQFVSAAREIKVTPHVAQHTKRVSGVRQAECRLSSVRRARLTFSKISEALAVQMKGLGFWLCLSMYSPMAMMSSSAS